MSAEEARVVDLVRRAQRRAQILLAVEVGSWALTGAAVTFAVGAIARVSKSADGRVTAAFAWSLTVVLVAAFAAVVAAAIVFARRRATVSRREVVRALERHQSILRNLLVTADELSRGTLTSPPVVRARVFAEASEIAGKVDVRSALPATRACRALATMCAAAIVAVAAPRVRDRAMPFAAGANSPAATSRAPAVSHITATIEPPVYTGLQARTLTDPLEIDAIEGSTATIRTVERTPRELTTARLTETGYLTVDDAAGERRIIPVVVTPDALPSATIPTPGRDLIYGSGNPRIEFDARATDDFGLRSLTLTFTKVSGSGEQFEFREGRIPLSIVRDDARSWRGSASRTLAELGLKEGDMLVYRAVAADARQGDGSASSDAYFIEVSPQGLTAADAFTLPEEETRYALSQQMLILKTGRLAAKRGSLAANELTDATLSLAVEQRMIRVEFVFMLGGEIEDEEVEAQESTELQEGRQQNQGQRDLRAATIAMSQAEKLLTAADLAAALTAERAAVAALQRAFARDRYILRALGQRANLDLTRRLTGDVSKAAGFRRAPVDAPANRRAALLESLLEGLADLTPDEPRRGDAARVRDRGSNAGAPGGPAPHPGTADAIAPDFRSRARLLAGQAIRIDAASADLRKAAAELQRAATTEDAAVRAAAIVAATDAAAAEARRSHASALLGLMATKDSIVGAFADAVRQR